jgi:hypothetical protein
MADFECCKEHGRKTFIRILTKYVVRRDVDFAESAV